MGFLLGLASSTHCLAMCGPLHIALAARQQGVSHYLSGRIAFNLGRTITYGILGVGVGLLGEAGSWLVTKQFVAIGGGLFMVGLALFPSFIRANLQGASMPITKVKNQILRYWDRKSLSGQALVGVFNGLLPCGTVYVALAGSLAMGHWFTGMGFMLAFGLGTIPALLAVAWGSLPITRWVARAPYVQPALALSVAAFLLFRGIYPSETPRGASCHVENVQHASIQCRPK